MSANLGKPDFDQKNDKAIETEVILQTEFTRVKPKRKQTDFESLQTLILLEK